ncbi:MAG: ABC transporter permease [Oscillospiraceae bacterium]|nr:ABC transporter permease [Oscillospiraceae bacterium]
MLRNTVSTVVFVALILVATFGYVLRALEYMVLTEKIEELGSVYRSIGFLRARENTYPIIPQDVFVGAEVIRNSRFLNFEDRRRGVGGSLVEGLNTVVYPWPDILLISSPMPEDPYRFHERDHADHTDVFFYGELIRKDFVRVAPADIDVLPHIELVFEVDYVLHGQPELVVAGQEIVLRYFLSEAEVEEDESAIGGLLRVKPTITNVDAMKVGQRYFVRGSFYITGGFGLGTLETIPQQGVPDAVLTMVPLNLEIDMIRRYMRAEGRWFVPVEKEELVDASEPGLENLNRILDNLRHMQSLVHLRTTIDMSAMPNAQQPNPSIWLDSGRWIMPEDNVIGNPVAVVHAWFAEMKGVGLGDSIIVEVPKDQVILGIHGPAVSSVPEILIAGDLNGSDAVTIDLVIIGLFRTASDVNFRQHDTWATNFIYVPDAVIPSGVTFSPKPQIDFTLLKYAFPRLLSLHMNIEQMVNEKGGNFNFLPHIWYSFVLEDPREEPAFLLEYREMLASLGFDILMLEQGAYEFWAFATPILQAIRFNAIVSLMVFVLILAFIAFLYIRRERTSYAIMRSLGVPVKSVCRRLMVSIFFISLPSMIVGGVGGRFVASLFASNTVNPFGEIVTHVPIDLSVSIPLAWLPALVVIPFAALLAMVLIGAVRMGRRPVLELLQGAAGGSRR